MDYIARMDFKEGDPVTYNREEELKILEEIVAEDVRKAAIKVQEADAKVQEADVKVQEISAKEQQVANEKQQLEEEKIEFAKALKAEGYPINKILKLTKLSKSKIMML